MKWAGSFTISLAKDATLSSAIVGGRPRMRTLAADDRPFGREASEVKDFSDI